MLRSGYYQLLTALYARESQFDLLAPHRSLLNQMHNGHVQCHVMSACAMARTRYKGIYYVVRLPSFIIYQITLLPLHCKKPDVIKVYHSAEHWLKPALSVTGPRQMPEVPFCHKPQSL